jgi:hypothetical protein
MAVRYSGFCTLVKYAGSMAQGFFVARLSVATISPLLRATSTRDVRIPYSTPFSVTPAVQGPRLYSSVRCFETALRSKEMGVASALVAVLKDSFTFQNLPATSNDFAAVTSHEIGNGMHHQSKAQLFGSSLKQWLKKPFLNAAAVSDVDIPS